jgi:hypothetical protein
MEFPSKDLAAAPDRGGAASFLLPKDEMGAIQHKYGQYAASAAKSRSLEDFSLPCYGQGALIVLSYHNAQLKHSKQRIDG